MVHYLFENFLENRDVYIRNVDYWQTTVKTILADSSKPSLPFFEYLHTNFANGTAFFDGNPIFNAIFNNKALRIIQEEPESQSVEISAWLNPIKIENKSITELVIALELSKESKEIAEYLLKAWIKKNVDVFEMQRLIDKIDENDFQYTTTKKVEIILKEALFSESL